MAALEDGKRKILAKLGAGSWYKNGVANLKTGLNETFGAFCDPARTLCKERAGDLDFEMQHGAMPDESGWRVRMISARLDKTNEHSATCASYTKASPPVELMADAWLDAHVPASVWFASQDPDFHRALTAAGGGFCGANYRKLVEAKMAADKKAEEAAEGKRKAALERSSKDIERIMRDRSITP